MARRRRKQRGKKEILHRDVFRDAQWHVHHGMLRRSPGHPGTAHLFRVVGEKLPFTALRRVERDLKERGLTRQGVYVAHDSMGSARYIGRGSIFSRLRSRKRHQDLELVYFSFYVVSDKKHEREIETLLIRAAGPLLEFNERKKRVGIAHGNIRDFEAGTLFYERQYSRGPRN